MSPAGPVTPLYVAGLPVIRADHDRALDMLWEDARGRVPHVYVLVNAYSATLRRDPAYAGVLTSDAIVPLADGYPMTLGARLTGQGDIGRCPGPDLLELACARAAGDGTTFYLLGGGDGVAKGLAAELEKRHPGLKIVGTDTPPYGEWPDDVNRAMIERVRASDADVVWLGVSAPKQEAWSVRWHEEVGRPIVCVGAAFDFLSGRKARAPLWMRRAGLEWLHRLFTEPKRLWRRYLIGNAVFLRDLVARRGRPEEAGPRG